MSKAKHVEIFLRGLFDIVLAFIMLYDPDTGYLIVVLILSLTMLITGARYFIFYFTMARHMVGGRRMLYAGLIFLEFGAYTFSIVDVPKWMILLYLAGVYAFDGLVDILRSLESKRVLAPSWKMEMVYGIFQMLIALSCFIFIRYTHLAVYIYGGGLIYSGIVKLIKSFRKTAIVYIQ